MQVLEEMVRQLMLGRLDNDALKLVGVDVSIAVLVEELESLSNALALETSEHLRKLVVVEVVSVLLAANVELRPLRVPIEGDVLRALVELVQGSEVVILDATGALNIEEAESNLVLGVGLLEEVLKDTPVSKAYTALTLAIGDTEKN